MLFASIHSLFFELTSIFLQKVDSFNDWQRLLLGSQSLGRTRYHSRLYGTERRSLLRRDRGHRRLIHTAYGLPSVARLRELARCLLLSQLIYHLLRKPHWWVNVLLMHPQLLLTLSEVCQRTLTRLRRFFPLVWVLDEVKQMFGVCRDAERWQLVQLSLAASILIETWLHLFLLTWSFVRDKLYIVQAFRALHQLFLLLPQLVSSITSVRVTISC